MTDDSGIESFEELQQAVDGQFNGSWPAFLDAVQNPVQLLGFVQRLRFAENSHDFQEWADLMRIPEPLVVAALETPNIDAPPPAKKFHGFEGETSL